MHSANKCKVSQSFLRSSVRLWSGKSFHWPEQSYFSQKLLVGINNVITMELITYKSFGIAGVGNADFNSEDHCKYSEVRYVLDCFLQKNREIRSLSWCLLEIIME